MNTPPALEERVTTLEYAVFEQFPATMAAMTHAATHIYEETVANGQAVAGLRVDMGSLEAALHREVADLKVAINLQGDSLRKELGAATAGFRADMTSFRELVDLRFQKVDGQFNGLHADMNQRFEAVDQRFTSVDHRFDAVDQRLDAVDQRFDAVDQRFDAVDQRFEGLDTHLQDLRADIDAKLDTILGELRRPTD